MSWILFAILAAFVWALVNVVDKFILSKWVKKPIVPLMIVSIVSLIVASFIYFVRGFSSLSFGHIILALFAGLFSASMTLFYFSALKREEVSRVVPLFYLAPLFIAILAAIFLGEVFSPLIYLGVIFLISGAILISTKKMRKIKLGAAFWLMIISSLSMSISQVIIKYLLNFSDFWTIFSYVELGVFLTLVPLFFFKFSDLMENVREKGKRVVWAVSGNTLLNVSAVLFMTIGISLGPVTLVNALASIQPFFVLLFMVMLSLFLPKILKEEIGKSVLVRKLIAIVLMFVGVLLIT